MEERDSTIENILQEIRAPYTEPQDSDFFPRNSMFTRTEDTRRYAGRETLRRSTDLQSMRQHLAKLSETNLQLQDTVDSLRNQCLLYEQEVEQGNAERSSLLDYLSHFRSEHQRVEAKLEANSGFWSNSNYCLRGKRSRSSSKRSCTVRKHSLTSTSTWVRQSLLAESGSLVLATASRVLVPSGRRHLQARIIRRSVSHVQRHLVAASCLDRQAPERVCASSPRTWSCGFVSPSFSLLSSQESGLVPEQNLEFSLLPCPVYTLGTRWDHHDAAANALRFDSQTSA